MKALLKFFLVGLLMTALLSGCNITMTREQQHLFYYHYELNSLAADTSLSETEKAALATEAADFIIAAQMYIDGEIALEDIPAKPTLWEMRDQQSAVLEAREAAPQTVAVLKEPEALPKEKPAPSPEPTPAPVSVPAPEPKPTVGQPAVAAVEPAVAAPAPSEVAEGGYSDWLFLRSDKWAFQYRMMLVDQIGETARLRLQLRIDENSRDFCTDPRCDGYVVTLRYADEHNETVSLHFRIHPGYSGIHTVPELLSTSLLTFPDGSSLAYDQRDGNFRCSGSAQPPHVHLWVPGRPADGPRT